MNIVYVNLKQSGLKGGEFHFYQEKLKNNRLQNILNKEYPKDPIHNDLEELFKKLRSHLLEICQIVTDDEGVNNFLILETKVNSVSIEPTGFVIGGEKRVFDDKSIKLETPLVEESDYNKFEEVMGILKQIQVESEQYLQGSKKVSEQEIIERYVQSGKSKDVDMDKFSAMSPEERREFCRKVLEKEFGDVVLMNEEHDEPQEDSNDPVEEIKSDFEIEEGADIIQVELPAEEEKPAKKSRKPKEASAPKTEPSAPIEEEF